MLDNNQTTLNIEKTNLILINRNLMCKEELQLEELQLEA